MYVRNAHPVCRCCEYFPSSRIRIAFPVEEITIAGNLKDMLMGITAVGADAYNYGAKTVGSIWVRRMKVAGS